MSEKKDITILAIESSCDETAAAVVRNGRKCFLTSFPLRLICISCTEESCRRSHQENILKKSTGDRGSACGIRLYAG